MQYARRILLAIFCMSAWSAPLLQAMSAAMPAPRPRIAEQRRVIKRDIFFANLLRHVMMQGLQSYTQADMIEHPHPLLHAAEQVASEVCDTSVTALATKALSRYTPIGRLNKLGYAVGPFAVRGKMVSRSLVQSAKIGIMNAAYFRKKYGAWWPVHFGKNVIAPMIVKSVVMGMIIPPVFSVIGMDKLDAWRGNSLLKNELCEVVKDSVLWGMHAAYNYIAPKALRVEL